MTELERRIEENQAALAAAASQPSLQDQFRQLDQAVESLEQKIDETHTSLRQEQQRLGEVLDQYQQTQASYREEESLQKSALLARLAQIDGCFGRHQAIEGCLRRGAQAETSKPRFKEIRQQVHEARTHLLRQELRLKMLVRELRKRAVAPADVAAVLADEMAHINDPLFVDHAASFRGSPRGYQEKTRRLSAVRAGGVCRRHEISRPGSRLVGAASGWSCWGNGHTRQRRRPEPGACQRLP